MVEWNRPLRVFIGRPHRRSVGPLPRGYRGLRHAGFDLGGHSGGKSSRYRSLPSNSWTATNFSTNDAYDLGYTVHAPVTGSSAPYPVLGGVDARVDFDLPIYAGSPSGPADTVAIELLMSNWSWQAPGDHLVVTLTLWPSFANEEHLVLGSSPESLVSSASTTSGTTFEQMAASTSAVANAGLPSATNIS